MYNVIENTIFRRRHNAAIADSFDTIKDAINGLKVMAVIAIAEIAEHDINSIASCKIEIDDHHAVIQYPNGNKLTYSIMPKFFYARLGCNGISRKYDDIAVFKTERERDAWLNYEDDFTRNMHITKADDDFIREIIGEETALHIIGDHPLINDPISTNIMWFTRSQRLTIRDFSKA